MKNKVIVAPLNWGLGHASRCVPIINSLLQNNYTPIIASDGNALEFLKKEFPNLETLLLPSYHIKYGKNLKLNLFFQLPKIWKAVYNEQKVIRNYLNDNGNVVGIISDNRFGVRSSKIPSVYITHQINVLSGLTTAITSKIHQNIIKKYDECWIPDFPNNDFSGKLSLSKTNLNQKYIGVLSRFKKQNTEKKIDILILLSGPEPNRSLLESKLKLAFFETDKTVVLVQGKVAEKQTCYTENNIKIYNFMLTNELENNLNGANKIICRAGYSSIMDLVSLEKQAVLIPTKNQTEQEYLAKYLYNKPNFNFLNIKAKFDK